MEGQDRVAVRNGPVVGVNPPREKPPRKVVVGKKRVELAFGGRFLRRIVRQYDLKIIRSPGPNRQPDANRDVWRCSQTSPRILGFLTGHARRLQNPIRGPICFAATDSPH